MPSKKFKYASSLAEDVVSGFDETEAPRELYETAVSLLEPFVQSGKNSEGFEVWPVEGKVKGGFLGLGRQKLNSPELEEAIVELSSAVYSATKKRAGMTLRPIQVATGIRAILPATGAEYDNSNSLEVATNEGKTYELPFAVSLFAAAGRKTGRKTVVMSSNDYLVSRDAELTGGIYQELGIKTVGVLRRTSSGVPIGFKYVDGGFSNAVSLFAKNNGKVNLDPNTFAAVADLEKRELGLSKEFNQAVSQGNVQGFFDFLGKLGYDPKVDIVFNPGLEYSARLSKAGLAKVYGEKAVEGDWEYIPFAMWGIKTGAVSAENPHLMPVSVESAKASEIIFSTPDAYSSAIRGQISAGATKSLIEDNRAYFVIDEADKTVGKLLENVAPNMTIQVDNSHLPYVYSALNAQGGLRQFKKEYSKDGLSPEAQIAAEVGIDPTLSGKKLKTALEAFVTQGLSKKEAEKKLEAIEAEMVKRSPKAGGLVDFSYALSKSLDASMLADYIALGRYDVIESAQNGLEFTENFTKKLESAGLYDASAVGKYALAKVMLENAIERKFAEQEGHSALGVLETVDYSGYSESDLSELSERIEKALPTAVYGRDFVFDENGELDESNSPGFVSLLMSLGGGNDPKENELLRGFLSERNEEAAKALVTTKTYNTKGRNYEVVGGKVRVMQEGKIKGTVFSEDTQNYLEAIEGVPLTTTQSFSPYELSALKVSLASNPFVAFSATLGGAGDTLDILGSTDIEAVPTYAEDGFSKGDFSLVEVKEDGSFVSAKPRQIGTVGKEFRYVKYAEDGETVSESRFVPKEGGLTILNDKKSHYSEIADLAKEGLSKGEGVVVAVNTIQNASELGKALSEETKANVRIVYGQDALSEATVYKMVSEGITIVLPEAGRGVNFPTKGKPMRLIVADVPQNSVEEHHLLNRVARDSPGEVFRVYNSNDPMISDRFRKFADVQTREDMIESFNNLFIGALEKNMQTATAYFADSLKKQTAFSNERAKTSLEYLEMRADVARMPETELREYATRMVSESVSGMIESARKGGYVDPVVASRKLAQVLPGSEEHWTEVMENAAYAGARKGNFGASVPEEALLSDVSKIYGETLASLPEKELRTAILRETDARIGLASYSTRQSSGRPGQVAFETGELYGQVGRAVTNYVFGKALETGRFGK